MVSTSRKNTRTEQRMPLSLLVLLMSLLLVLIVPGSLAFQPLIDTTRTTMSRHSGTGSSSSSSYYDLSGRVGGSLMAPPMINSAPHQQQQQRKHKSCLLAKKPQKRGGYSSNNSGSKSTPMRAERIRKPRDDVIEVEATVQESLPNAMFRCSINQKTINANADDANGAAASSSSAEPNTTPPPPPPPPPPPSTSTSNQPLILATISGKIRQNMVKILVGDRVLIELSPYDLTRGRITFRYRS
jgi:translation initiation factor IF-1